MTNVHIGTDVTSTPYMNYAVTNIWQLVGQTARQKTECHGGRVGILILLTFDCVYTILPSTWAIAFKLGQIRKKRTVSNNKSLKFKRFR